MSIDQPIDFNPITIATDTLLKDAIALMSQKSGNNSIKCIAIAKEQKFVGVLTQGDVVRLVAEDVDLATVTVEEVMTQPAIALNLNQCQDYKSVLSLFQQHSVDHAPVLDDEQKLVGFVDCLSVIRFGHISDSDRERIVNEPDGSRLQLKPFFDLTPSLLCIAGLDGYFKRVNPAFSNILGYTQAELLAQPFIRFIHPEDRAATIAEVEYLTAGKTSISFENRYLTKDGDYRWLMWTAKADLSASTIYAVGLDNTDRKKSELALKENEQRWELALRGANDGIWDWNVKTNEVFFSRRWKEMLGFAENEVDNTLEEWSKRVHPDDLGWVTETIQDHFAGKTPFYVSEHRVLCKDGSYKWILDRGQALWDEAGEVVRMTGSHTDITDRQQAEFQLQQERDFSEAVINTVGTLVAVMDRQGRIVSFNRTCEKITGYSFAEIKGKQVWDFLIPPEEKTTIQAVFERLLRGQFHSQYENYWVAKDGSKNLISWSNTALFDPQGEIEFIIATGIDVTEQRRVWNKLEFQYRQTKLLTEITDKIRLSIAIDDILQTTVTEVQQLLACDRVLIVKINSHNTAIPISEAILPDLTPMLGYELADPLLMGEHLARYHQGQVLAIDDLAIEPVSLDIKQLLQTVSDSGKTSRADSSSRRTKRSFNCSSMS